MKKPLALLIALSLAYGTETARAELAPALADRMAALSVADTVQVLVVLEDQVDVPQIDLALRGAKASRGTRHRTIVESLRTRAAQSQKPLIDELIAARGNGEVFAFEPHWLLNAIAVKATAGHVRELATRPGVAVVESLPVIASLEPVAAPRVSVRAEGTVGITPGLTAIGVPRVWRELGIDGTGTLVGIIDSGVDGQHPALAASWQGRFGPPEHAWHDTAEMGDVTPVDRSRNSHGTHVLGTMVGRAPGDSIGVAPGARWIASNATLASLGEIDHNAVAAFEFMTDPDGDPTTTDDVPDVVQNSWGVRQIEGLFESCYSAWWAAIDNCEAAGVVVVWAAGNEGPGPGSLRSPADRATSFANSFSVGAVDVDAPHEIAPWSSRGPSDCGGPYAVKPEIAAPGVEVVSAVRGGGYQVLSGTSMAGPHVAGVVALMRQAYPDLEVATIKEILMETARDLGEPGEDNAYGHGMVDAYAAVLRVMTDVGSIEGVVRNRATGEPLSKAVVGVPDRGYRYVTGPDGRYRLTLPAGARQFEVSHFSHHPATVTRIVPVGTILTADHSLAPLPTAAISGVVRDPEGNAVTGARVSGVGVLLDAAVTGEDGRYSLALPNGPGRIYEIRASGPGFGPRYRSLELRGDMDIDFDLPQERVEDFERGSFEDYPWSGSGAAPWFLDAEDPYQGAWSASSGDIINGQFSKLEIVMYVSGASPISFWHRVSSERNYDYLYFFVDEDLAGSWSGEREWDFFSMDIPRGERRFTWVYAKDVAYTEGEDRALIDVISWPVTGEVERPTLGIDTGQLSAAVAAGEREVVPLRIANTGRLVLEYGLQIGPALGKDGVYPDNPIPHADLAKGEADTRGNWAPINGSGNTDRFGYRWVDDTWHEGPVFDWEDIRADWVELALSDDEMAGPLVIGFPFRFYGRVHDRVWVDSNGLLRFSAGASEFTNQGIPDASSPDDLVAGFWDDLDPSAGGSVHYRVDPDAERFIVQFQDVPVVATGEKATFQIHLIKGGSILFQYQDVPEFTGATVGLEGPWGRDGSLLLFNGYQYLVSGRVLRFTPPAVWATVDRTSGILAPDRFDELKVTFDATGVDPGAHAAFLTVRSNDPETSERTIPLVLSVVDKSAPPPVPSALEFRGAVPNPFNAGTELVFGLPEPGRVTLTVYDVAGRRIRSLRDSDMPAGVHAVAWDGRDGAGRSAGSGTYFARLVTPAGRITRSLTLVR